MREYRLAIGRPADACLLLVDDHGEAWDKTAWQMWRVDRWAPACRAVGLDPVPRPYDLRHSFASLLLAEGRQPLYVAKQLGHSLAVLLSTYAHLIDEYAERQPIDAEGEITKARKARVLRVRRGCLMMSRRLFSLMRKRRISRAFVTYRYRDSNPGFRRERAAS